MQNSGVGTRATDKKNQSTKDRKTILNATGQQIATGKTKINLPTDQEIEDFQAQLNTDTIMKLATAFKNQFTTLKQKISFSQF